MPRQSRGRPTFPRAEISASDSCVSRTALSRRNQLVGDVTSGHVGCSQVRVPLDLLAVGPERRERTKTKTRFDRNTWYIPPSHRTSYLSSLDISVAARVVVVSDMWGKRSFLSRFVN